MNALNQAHCEACRADAPKVSEQELAELIREIPDWNIEVRDGHMELERVFLFKNFKHALAFTNAVGEIAEAEGHHPGLLTEWGKVTVTWWSHSIKGRLHHVRTHRQSGRDGRRAQVNCPRLQSRGSHGRGRRSRLFYAARAALSLRHEPP